MEFAQRIGVSTDSLFDVSFDDAIQCVADAGFHTFEIVPADFQGAGGFPYSRLNPGVWPRTFGQPQRRQLRETLQCFDLVTVHAPHLGVDIGSRNPGIREESRRQYLECVELAVDIGVRVVSFHHSGVEASVEFGRQALPLAHEHDLLLAYENGPQSMPVITEILDRLDDERLGLLLDVGHAANGRANVTDIITSFAARLFEIHVSGVYRSGTYFPTDGWGIDHYPFGMNDGVEYARILETLAEVKYQGPMVLEICYARHNHEIVDSCLQAKEHLVGLYGDH